MDQMKENYKQMKKSKKRNFNYNQKKYEELQNEIEKLKGI